MDFSDLDDPIAALAHRCWCKHVLAEGGKAGKVFDPETREHDKIRSYRELPESTRSQLRQRIDRDKLDQVLMAAAHDLMMRPEFAVDDVYVGMRVVFLDDPEGNVGTVVGWEAASAPGLLESLRVQWPDGETVDYAPNEEYLVCIDDLQS